MMSEPSEETPTYVPIEVVGRRLSLAITTLRQWVKTGVIPSDTYIKVGQTYRFNLPAVVHALTDTEEPRDKVTPKQLQDFTNDLASRQDATSIDPDEDM